MTIDDRIRRIGGGDAEDRLLAGALEIESDEEPVGLVELIDRMSETGHSAAALDLMAMRIARLLVTDRRVDDLLQGAR